METLQTLHVEHRGDIRCISWGAVIAGVVVTLSVAAVLNLLGLGLDLREFHFDRHTIANMSFLSLVWLVLTSFFAILAGSWFAGRLAGPGYAHEGALHGLVTWAVTTLLTFGLVATSVGAAVGVMSNLIGHGMYLSVQTAPANQANMGMAPADQAVNQANATQGMNQTQQDQQQAMLQAEVEKDTRNLGNIALITFFTFLITAVASAFGGMWGAYSDRKLFIREERIEKV